MELKSTNALKNSGVYKIQSKHKPERCYVGSAKNITYRWYTHLNNLKKNKHHTPKLQHHYNKYGKNDLEFSILLCCDIEDLIVTEQFFMDALNPWFNHRKRADNNLGVKYSEESKARMRGRHWKWSDESRAKMVGNRNGVGNKNRMGKAPANKGKSKYASKEEHDIAAKEFARQSELRKKAKLAVA